MPRKVLGISVDEPAEVLCSRVAELATKTAAFMGESLTFTASDILVNDHYTGAAMP